MMGKGYAEMVPQEETDQVEGRTWCVSHHAVYHPKKKPLRVVFDCGAAYQGVSLNTELLQGPDLTNSLVGILLRFHQESIAVMADIISMYYQVRVPRLDVNFLRFLWWPEGDIEQNPKDHCMLVHLFGAVSSPSCASFALRETVEDNNHMRTVPTVQEAVQLRSDLVDLCNIGGFQLTK